MGQRPSDSWLSLRVNRPGIVLFLVGDISAYPAAVFRSKPEVPVRQTKSWTANLSDVAIHSDLAAYPLLLPRLQCLPTVGTTQHSFQPGLLFYFGTPNKLSQTIRTTALTMKRDA